MFFGAEAPLKCVWEVFSLIDTEESWFQWGEPRPQIEQLRMEFKFVCAKLGVRIH